MFAAQVPKSSPGRLERVGACLGRLGSIHPSPAATSANLMVMEPGGYRFHDYWELGSVVLVWYFVISVLLVPLIWNL